MCNFTQHVLSQAQNTTDDTESCKPVCNVSTKNTVCCRRLTKVNTRSYLRYSTVEVDKVVNVEENFSTVEIVQIIKNFCSRNTFAKVLKLKNKSACKSEK